MSWSNGLQLLVNVILKRDFGILAKNKVTAEMLRPEEKPLYDFIKKVHENRRTHGSIPSIDDVCDRFPSLALHEIQEHPDPDYLAHMIHEEQLRGKLKQEAMKLARLADTDPYAAMEHLQSVTYEITSKHERGNGDLHLSSSASIVSDNLRLILDSGGLLGAPWPWEEMNRATMGVKQGDLILFYGRPKSGKTHLTLYTAVSMYRRGYRVLWCNIEMTLEQIATRAAIALCDMNYTQVTHNPTHDQIDLIESEIQSLSVMEEMEGSRRSQSIPKRFIVADVATPADIHAKIMETKPDIVFVDTANDLKDNEGSKKPHDAAKNVVISLRRITRDRNLGCPPVICSAHANREGDKDIASGYGDIAGTDQWGRTCDLVVRVLRVREPDTQEYMCALLPPQGGGRDVVWDGMFVRYNPYTEMAYYRDTTREEIMEIVSPNDNKRGRAREAAGNAPARRAPRQRRPAEDVTLEGVPWAGSDE